MLKSAEYITVISLTFLIAVLLISAQISPGRLSEPHAHLEGLSNCTKCHLLGEKVTSEKCLECHIEIAAAIKGQHGYHFSAEVREKECIECHSDHHGREFQMIHFDAGAFDHTLTGYTLQGAHAGLNCEDCHNSELISSTRLKERTSTYLGLDQTCLSCHLDYHQSTLSTECSSCHDFEVFRPASGFEHRQTRFELLGKHALLDCTECHKISVFNGVEMQEFAGISFGNCTSCHVDVHDNKFGQNCVQCHSEESFTRIKQMNTFNHSLTNYPLEGKHQSVACAACHKNQYTSAIQYHLCSDCHTDYHRKQFMSETGAPDCSDCHTTLGFERSTFTIERHNEAGFELTGAHLATPCFACHKKNEKWSFREIGNRCMDCHNDIHESYLDKEFYQEATCESCHSSSRWSEINFDHSKTNFELEGAHLNQSCRSCHFRSDENGNEYQEFSQLSSSCTNCHQDVHYSQFEVAGETNCLRCHGFSDWTAAGFDHDQTAFKLTGKHQDVACIKCHVPAITDGEPFIQYKLADFSCESCH